VPAAQEMGEGRARALGARPTERARGDRRVRDVAGFEERSKLVGERLAQLLGHGDAGGPEQEAEVLRLGGEHVAEDAWGVAVVADAA